MKVDLEKYRALNLKLTPQRIAIFEYLEGNKSHPSVYDVYKYVVKKFPSMSFATVYNTLNTLVRNGKLKELSVDPDKKRFDPNTHPHHHLRCIKCSKIIDVELDYNLDLHDNKFKDFEILGSEIEFYGLCNDCKNKIKQ